MKISTGHLHVNFIRTPLIWVHMGRKTVALSLDEGIYKAYRKYCKEQHIILSRKVEDFMKKELEKNG